MIPPKIQALFDLIDHLHRNKNEYIEKYIPLCDELKALDSQRSGLKPNENYRDKQKYDNIQRQIKEKFSPIVSNIYLPISNKLKELELWDGDDTYASIWNNNYSVISDFKTNFTPEDAAQVTTYKRMYLTFRIETNTDFLCLTFFFQNLDELLKELFDFFKDTDENEFDSFETKTVHVNSMEEAIKGLAESKGENVRFSIPNEIPALGHNGIRTDFKKIVTEIIMGDKIQVGNISNNNGPISIGKENTTKSKDGDEISKKSFHWQKWGIITATILTIIAIIVAIIIG